MLSLEYLIKIILISILIFLLCNYFINSNGEIRIINEIISQKKREDESDKNYIFRLERLKSKYKSQRFRTYIKRGVCFGVLMGLCMHYSFNMRQGYGRSIWSPPIINTPPSITNNSPPRSPYITSAPNPPNMSNQQPTTIVHVVESPFNEIPF
jgi:hypothetical protein